jgi:hypothetical protein
VSYNIPSGDVCCVIRKRDDMVCIGIRNVNFFFIIFYCQFVDSNFLLHVRMVAFFSNREASLAQVISENHRLRDDKTKLFNLLADRQSTYTAETRQLREMVSICGVMLELGISSRMILELDISSRMRH